MLTNWKDPLADIQYREIMKFVLVNLYGTLNEILKETKTQKVFFYYFSL